MGVIVNYWLLMTPSFDSNLQGVLPIIQNRNPREDGPAVSTQSVQFPLLNVLREDTKKMMRAFRRRYGGDFAPGLWNCYARADGLYALVAMREEIQRLQATYPDNFDVGGCWVYDTGQPVGGVGSPWFYKPPNLADFLPPKPQPQPPNTEFPPTEVTPPLPGVVWDVILGAGQAPRMFI